MSTRRTNSTPTVPTVTAHHVAETHYITITHPDAGALTLTLPVIHGNTDPASILRGMFAQAFSAGYAEATDHETDTLTTGDAALVTYFDTMADTYREMGDPNSDHDATDTDRRIWRAMSSAYADAARVTHDAAHIGAEHAPARAERAIRAAIEAQS